MTVTGSLSNAADVTITRTETAELVNVEQGSGTVYDLEMSWNSTSVEVPA